MLRIAITSVALAFSVPVLAQSAQGSDPASGGVATGSAAPTAAEANRNASSQVASVVESEFPVYDADKSGDLDSTEFSKWMLALKQQEMQATGKTMAAAELNAWVEAAFQMADADKNSKISKAELIRYLGG